MSQIMYNYTAMLGHAGDMSGYAGTLQGLGADIASEQAALSNAWQGDTGMTYQVWQAQWNQAMEALVRAYQSMASTHGKLPAPMVSAMNHAWSTVSSTALGAASI